MTGEWKSLPCTRRMRPHPPPLWSGRALPRRPRATRVSPLRYRIGIDEGAHSLHNVDQKVIIAKRCHKAHRAVAVVQGFHLVRIQPSFSGRVRDWWKFDHQLLAGEPLLGVTFARPRDDDRKAGGLCKPHGADDQRKMRPGQFMAG